MFGPGCRQTSGQEDSRDVALDSSATTRYALRQCEGFARTFQMGRCAKPNQTSNYQHARCYRCQSVQAIFADCPTCSHTSFHRTCRRLGSHELMRSAAPEKAGWLDLHYHTPRLLPLLHLPGLEVGKVSQYLCLSKEKNEEETPLRHGW